MYFPTVANDALIAPANTLLTPPLFNQFDGLKKTQLVKAAFLGPGLEKIERGAVNHYKRQNSLFSQLSVKQQDQNSAHRGRSDTG